MDKAQLIEFVFIAPKFEATASVPFYGKTVVSASKAYIENNCAPLRLNTITNECQR